MIKYLFWKAKKDGYFVGSTKIQKLLWYCQLLYYAKYEKFFFDGDTCKFEAWDYGPVNRETWSTFAEIINEKYENQNIDGLINSHTIWEEYNLKKQKYNQDFWNKLSNKNKDELEVVDKVWELKKRYHGWDLANKTHEHEPWKEAHERDIAIKEIDQKLIKKHARKICKRENLIQN